MDIKKPPQKTEELLLFVEELKKQWMTTVDAISDAVMVVNVDYEILKANKAMAQATGLNVKSLVGKTCFKVFARRNQPCRDCPLHQSIDLGQMSRFILEEIQGKFVYEGVSHPLIDLWEDLPAAVHVYRDKTEERLLQQLLVQQEKLASIGLLAGGVAHEINNPLGGILAFAQMMLREMSKESPHYGDVQEIESAALRCKNIVEQLLSFARQSPEMSEVTDVKAIDGIDALRSALRFCLMNFGAKKWTIIEDFESHEIKPRIDRNKLIQVFLNLLQNACQAMPGGGKIVLRAYHRNEAVCFEIEDSGPGIPAKQIKHIFDPFFTTKEPGKGTGLGLSICYSIIKQYAGRIEVASRVGKGSVFRVTLLC